MTKGRVEAFSDGVFAVVITITVLELKVPATGLMETLRPVLPVLASYALSFAFIGIYWNNHHHMFQAVNHVNGRVLLANLHLLFWLSLIPFLTGWVGVTGFAPVPMAFYGLDFFLASIAYYMLARSLLALHPPDSTLAKALGRDVKGKFSSAAYLIAMVLALKWPLAAGAIYLLVAIIWIIPDLRIERALRSQEAVRSRRPSDGD